MLCKMVTEMVLKHEKVLFKLIDGRELVLHLDVSSPRPHELPGFELLKEG